METPYYLIEEERMLPALKRIRHLQAESGVRCLLALKCFSARCAFDFMKGFFAGTTSSSLYEARLGREEFGGETHGYSVAYDASEITEVVRLCDKVIFNSVSQLERFQGHTSAVSVGLRLNPEVGHSRYPLANPARRYSRLGVRADQLPPDIAERIDGAMAHVNCDNDDFSSFCAQLDRIDSLFGALLPRLTWLSLGGGIAFTNPGYPLDAFSERLRAFSSKHSLQLYLEPGEAAVNDSTSLVVTVLDIVRNEIPTLVVDAGVEPHMLDVLTYEYTPALEGAVALPRDDYLALREPLTYRVCGRTCLSGDLFGTYRFDEPVSVGQRLRFTDAGAYSMVKKNFFNGLRMPAIHRRDITGRLHHGPRSSYEAFRDAL